MDGDKTLTWGLLSCKALDRLVALLGTFVHADSDVLNKWRIYWVVKVRVVQNGEVVGTVKAAHVALVVVGERHLD